MENPELLLLEIEEFNRNSGSDDDQIPQNLENFIEFVSKTGTYIFPWNIVRKLFLRKLNSIINNLQACMSLSTSDLNASSSSGIVINQNTANDANSIQLIKDRIIERMKSFSNAPFTIQRICELLLKPNNHYNRVDKFLRGLEKCIMVVTTVDPNGNKIFMENMLTNGISSNPSTPLITPTRPITPVEVLKETSNDSSVLNTPVKDSQEIPPTSESILKPVIEPKSNEEAIEIETAEPNIEETKEVNKNIEKIVVEEEKSIPESENAEIAKNQDMDNSIEMDQVTDRINENNISSSEMIISNQEMTVTCTEMEITKTVVSNNEMIVTSTDVILSTEKIEEELKPNVTEISQPETVVEEKMEENKNESSCPETVE